MLISTISHIVCLFEINSVVIGYDKAACLWVYFVVGIIFSLYATCLLDVAI